MLRVSTAFAVIQCPSICLFLMFVYSIQTAEDITKLLCQPGSPIILVFLTPNAVLPSAGCKIHGCWKNLRFSTKITVISETARDRPMVAMER